MQIPWPMPRYWQWGMLRTKFTTKEIISSISPLLTFHLYIATLKQHYSWIIYLLVWYDIPLLVFLSGFPYVDCCQLEAPLFNFLMNIHFCIHFMNVTQRSELLLCLFVIGCYIIMIYQQMPPVEQEVHSRPDLLNSYPVFSGVRIAQYVNF